MAHYNDNYDNRGNRRFEEQYGTNSSQRHEEWNQGDQNVRNRGQVHQGMQGRYEHEGHNNSSDEYRGRYDYESTPDYRQHSSQHGQWGGGMRQETGGTSGNQGYSNQSQGSQGSGNQLYGNQQYGNQGYGQQSSGSGHGSYNNQGYSSQSQVGGHSYGNQQHGDQGYGQQASGSGHGSYNNQGYSSQSQGGNQGYDQQSSGRGMQGNQQWSGNQSYGNPSTSNSERGNMNRPGTSSFEGATGLGNTTGGQVPTYTGTAGSTMGHTSGNQWGGSEGSSGQWTRDQGNYGSRQELGAGYNQEYNRGRYGSQANTFGEGPHRGRGPKGFQRSDERIKEEVCERLSEHGYLDASDIEVEVQAGEVILKGTVQSRQDKRTAEDVVESLSGVADVQNQLRVQRENGSEKNSQNNSSQQASLQSSSSQNTSSTASKQQPQSGGNGSSQTQQAKSSSSEDASKSTKK